MNNLKLKIQNSKLTPRSEFSRNVLTLMTGTTIAKAIPIAISPILTRIYTPEDFGVFALFISITSILATIANGRYELAIMLPKKDEDAINIFALGFIITCIMTIITFILVLIFNDYFTNLLGNKEIGFWLYFMPLALFFSGLSNILNYFNNRRKNYKDLRNATILKSIILAVVQISVGFIKGGAIGLISGSLLSNMFANMKLARNILKDKMLLSKIKKVKIITLSKKYKDFPKFSMPAGLLNSSATNLNNTLIPTFFSLTTLGFYSLVGKVLSMPSSLISGSIGQVFFQQASYEKKKTGSAHKVFKQTTIRLILLAIPIFTILYFTVEDIFTILFGEKWSVAGTYAKILIPLFFVQFVVSPLTLMNVINKKNKLLFKWQSGLMFLYLLCYFLSNNYSFNFIDFLKTMVYIISIYYIFCFYLIFKYSKD